MTVQTAEEITNRARTYIVAGRIAFGLDVNAIKAESILVNDPVNAIIAGTAESATCILVDPP